MRIDNLARVDVSTQDVSVYSEMCNVEQSQLEHVFQVNAKFNILHERFVNKCAETKTDNFNVCLY